MSLGALWLEGNYHRYVYKYMGLRYFTSRDYFMNLSTLARIKKEVEVKVHMPGSITA